jgi:hypothetical protein
MFSKAICLFTIIENEGCSKKEDKKINKAKK